MKLSIYVVQGLKALFEPTSFIIFSRVSKTLRRAHVVHKFRKCGIIKLRTEPSVRPDRVIVNITDHLTGCDKKSLCDFFRANLHRFTRFQRRKTTLMLFNRQFECKGIIKHLF